MWLFFWLGLGGCANRLSQLLPADAVLSPAEADAFDVLRPSAVIYTGPPRLRGPLPPLQIFGVYYAVDVVLVSEHPDWDMHEYARLDGPDGPIWMAKDSDQNGVQTIIAELPDIEAWVADVAVPRRAGAIAATERWDGDRLTLDLAYTNIDGEPVELSVQARMPAKPPGLRNGNTMGHSRQAVSAALDLERMGHGGSATMSIGGEPQRIERLLGVYRMQFLLQQAQGGFSQSSYFVTSVPEGIRVIRPGAPDVDWPTRADEQWVRTEADEQTTLRYDDGYLVREYVFQDGGLWQVTITQHGRALPVTHAVFQPPLPDVTRPFEGVGVSRFRLDINQQVGHAVGEVRVRWADEDTVDVQIVPEAPDWVASRPIGGTVRYQEDGARVELRRVD
ncbi:MAG: hypothetical protein AAFV53_24070 [Myxococcota bacterium]